MRRNAYAIVLSSAPFRIAAVCSRHDEAVKSAKSWVKAAEPVEGAWIKHCYATNKPGDPIHSNTFYEWICGGYVKRDGRLESLSEPPDYMLPLRYAGLVRIAWAEASDLSASGPFCYVDASDNRYEVPAPGSREHVPV